MNEDRHINFKLMRDRILALSDPPAVAGGSDNLGVTNADLRLNSEELINPQSAIRNPQSNGKTYWRSLEELIDAPEFREFVQREFPQQAENWDDPLERRTFLKLMGASLALAGLSGCVYQAPEKIVPYVKQPEEIVPSQALLFATAFSVGGVATPLLARSNEGRPTKVEGNPDHPNNRRDTNDPGLSATDIFSQASVLTLYDPDRSQTSLYRDDPRPWSAFVDAIRG